MLLRGEEFFPSRVWFGVSLRILLLLFDGRILTLRSDPFFEYSHVTVALKALMKGVRAKGGDFEEDDLDDIVGKVREKHEKDYLERQGGGEVPDSKSKSKGSKGKGKATGDDSDVSMDSMM